LAIEGKASKLVKKSLGEGMDTDHLRSVRSVPSFTEHSAETRLQVIIFTQYRDTIDA